MTLRFTAAQDIALRYVRILLVDSCYLSYCCCCCSYCCHVGICLFYCIT